jgi:glycosyltransferase involved in cell wall biosynthesis
MLRCIAVARLIERKGLDDLLAALALLERGRVRLEIVGSGPRAAYLRALADRLGVSADLCFAGALDRRQVAERYRGADLFTLAPLQEAFGNAFAEALASGLPIVGSRVGGIPEFVRDGENGILVPPRDPAALAAAIRRFADSPSLRAETSRRNRLRAQAELSWDFATERYLDVYREARSRGRASNPSGPAPARARPSA